MNRGCRGGETISFNLKLGTRVGNYRILDQLGRRYEGEGYSAVEIPSGARLSRPPRIDPVLELELDNLRVPRKKHPRGYSLWCRRLVAQSTMRPDLALRRAMEVRDVTPIVNNQKRDN